MKEGQCGLRAGHVGQQKMRPEGHREAKAHRALEVKALDYI